MRRLAAWRDECIIEAFSDVSERLRRIAILWVSSVSLVVFAALALGQVQTVRDAATLQDALRWPVAATVVVLFWYGVLMRHERVKRAFLSLPVTSFIGFAVFLAAAFIGSLALRGAVGAIWWGTMDIALAVLDPIGEEIIYRFLLLYSIASLSNRWIAIVVSALLFGGLHAVGIGAFAASAAIGALFALITMRYGSLLPAYCAHAIFNATALLV